MKYTKTNKNEIELVVQKTHTGLHCHKGAVNTVYCRDDTVYSGGADGSIKVWPLENFLVRCFTCF